MRELIKVQQDVKILTNTLLTYRQQRLMKIQRVRAINLESTDTISSELSDSELKKISSPFPGLIKSKRESKRL